MKRNAVAVVLSLLLLLGFVSVPAAIAEESLLGATILDIRADAAVVEIYDAPGEEPSFSYDPSRYTVIREKEGDTLSITIEPRRKYLHGSEPMQMYLPIGDFSSIHLEVNASELNFPPFDAGFTANVNASAFTCYLAEGFAHDLRIEANASSVKTNLHISLGDFTVWVDEIVSSVSFPNGMRSGDRIGDGTHTLDFQTVASKVDVTWYTDATPIPYEEVPEDPAE